MIILLALMLFEEPFKTKDKGVTPPNVTYKAMPLIPTFGHLLNMDGYVVLKCIVGKDGKAHNIRIERGLGRGHFGFEAEAIYALRRWEFEPGRFEGRPVDVEYVLKFDFTKPSFRLDKQEKAMWKLGRNQKVEIELIQARTLTALEFRDISLEKLWGIYPVLEGTVNTRDAAYYEDLKLMDTEINRLFPRTNWINLGSFKKIKPGMSLKKVSNFLGGTLPIAVQNSDKDRTYVWVNCYGDGQLKVTVDSKNKVISKSQDQLKGY